MKLHTKICILIIFNLISLINLQSSNAQMFWNQAAQFAGNSTSYVSVPYSSSINLTGSFSIQAWVNPSNTTNKGVIAKGGALGTSLRYAIRITTSKVTILTNGAPRLSSKSTSLIPVNTWTHITTTYNSSTNEFRIYINGSLDTSAIVAGAVPASNTDSLFIGISGASTPFNGKLDEVRLWNRELSFGEQLNNFRTSLGATSGLYSGLILSMTFQERNSFGSDFSAEDISNNGNNGFARNVAAQNQGDNPYSTIHFNESIELDGTDDYLTGKDTSTIDVQTGVTLECWVYPNSLSSSVRFISKGQSPAVYALGYAGTILAIINNTTISTTKTIPLERWSHIAFKYNSNGFYTFFLNGISLTGGTNNLGTITNSADSIYIGGGPALTDFNGFIDEVRITNGGLINELITGYSHKSIDKGNDTLTNLTNVSYNFDGLLTDNAESGGPKLILRGNAKFSHPANTGNPVSPINRDDAGFFYSGYYMRILNFAGTDIKDSLMVNIDLSITDLNLYVAINHDNSQEVEITLTGPEGDSVKVFSQNTTNSDDNNVIAVFDDNADSSLINGRYISFSPSIRPLNSLNSIFSSKNCEGKWKLRITTNSRIASGTLYAWGVQVNNQSLREKNLEVHAYMQGFYNPATNLMIPDTMRVVMRNSFPPYAIIDTLEEVLDNQGIGLFSHNITLPFYTVLHHRNSIETWSGTAVGGDVSWKFNLDDNIAFGNNQIQVDNSPNRFAIYSGDVNQDGVVDATDAGAIDNDAFNFITGYVVTDITGDDLVDATDAAIVDNNAANFVGKITP